MPASAAAPERLHSAMRYAVLGGGKRIRPLLCHAAGSIFAAQEQRLDAAACAIELIHAYSLVHDDLPCMDNDTLRRGKPTCHIQFDEATALLVGDALQSLAFQILADNGGTPDMLSMLAHAAGSRGMAGGQAIDLASVGKSLSLDQLETMHRHKTGALIRAAVLLGAQSGTGEATLRNRLAEFADHIGLLFQIVDDILDTEASTATLGKTAGKDAQQMKPTYVSLLGINEAKRRAAQLCATAHAVLEPCGADARRLHQLTDYIVDRSF